MEFEATVDRRYEHTNKKRSVTSRHALGCCNSAGRILDETIYRLCIDRRLSLCSLGVGEYASDGGETGRGRVDGSLCDIRARLPGVHGLTAERPRATDLSCRRLRKVQPGGLQVCEQCRQPWCRGFQLPGRRDYQCRALLRNVLVNRLGKQRTLARVGLKNERAHDLSQCQ